MKDPVVFTGAPGKIGSFVVLSNPARAALAFIKATGASEIDAASFDRVAELCGDATPEQLANGFLIDNYGALQRLCDIGDFCIFTHAKTGLVTAWRAGDGETPEQIARAHVDD
jgi:hypothetical protein